jgi:hypothetical protein
MLDLCDSIILQSIESAFSYSVLSQYDTSLLHAISFARLPSHPSRISRQRFEDSSVSERTNERKKKRKNERTLLRLLFLLLFSLFERLGGGGARLSLLQPTHIDF